MDDLISRQAAIDEIEERKFANRTVIPVVSELNRLERYVLRLPSAQLELIRCKDCKYYHPNYCAAWIRFDTIKTKPDDYCSRAERREDEQID